MHGIVENPMRLTYDDLLRLRRTELTCDVHCVRAWSTTNLRWEGVRLKDVIELARPKQNAKFVILGGANVYKTSLSLEDAHDVDNLIAFKAQGRDLEIAHGGPVRLLVPKKYLYKSPKWLEEIVLSEHDELGLWEGAGYSSTADPWEADRHT